MIEETSFLGLPLRTQAQRRGLVMLYNGLLVLFAAVAFWHGHGRNMWILLPQTLTLGGLLGGIRIGGPVKAYTEPTLPLEPGDSSLTTLHLTGKAYRPAGHLDERETEQRDHAHYLAFRVLRWTLGPLVLLYLLTTGLSYAWVASRAPILAWFLLVYVLSLPQSVLLWTEPGAPRAELLEMHSAG